MTEISEAALEEAIEAALVEGSGEGTVAEPQAGYGDDIPGGYLKRRSKDYDRHLCLLPDDVIDFLVSTQPKEWQQLRQYYGDEARKRFLKRLAKEIERKGTLEVLRRGIKDSGVKVRLAYFRPHSGLNEELQQLYQSNLFSLVRQLRYSDGGPESVDVALFLNGLPLFTAELKNPFTGQNVRHAVTQYRQDRDPREPLFAFGRCLAHFAVDPDQVYVTTHLTGPKTRFLPFNKGYNQGAGNPPPSLTRSHEGSGYKTAYLWEEVWAKDSVLNLIQHFVHRVETEEGGKKNGKQIQLFPRYHQLDAVRRLVNDARRNGAGEQYLIQHSAGSGKSFTIAWLAHWLSVLHDDHDERVFDSIVVITDRRVLDQQLQETIRQFEQTLGVVENIDTTSKQLKQALEEGKTIIVTTLQKFPVIVDQIGELSGRRFAIIVDEAHSSQSGESTKALKEVLAADSLEAAAAEEEAVEPEDLEDLVVAEMTKRGRLANASTFAFTATPKQKTLELFGTRREEDGKFEPFSLYSMRQAIEEGFILDVLENYTTYTTYWKLLKTIEEDPRYDKRKAQSLLRSFVDLHEHSIRQKVEIMVEHFHEHVEHRIDGRAKAMVVTRSRKHCVRYKLALDTYLEEQGYPYRSLVAFSGKVEDEGADFTEAGMNGIPESQTKAAFERPEVRFLVVANKFQTGFDQPLLHTMYVDKRLGGVNAVQTLSRLNRTHPAKEETMVLDFANEAETIRTAFEPYYETTLLSEATDPNVLYDRQHELEEFAVFTEEDVDSFAALYFTKKPQDRLYRALKPIKERAESELDEEALADFRGALRDYVRQYAFLSQVIPFTDPDLEKLYVFARLLRSYLRSPSRELPQDIREKIDMDSLRIQRSFTGKIRLERGATDLEPLGEHGGRRPQEEEVEPLSRIIRELNERYGANLGPEDRITLGRILDRAEEKDSLRLSVENNTEENARLAFETVVTDMLQELVDTNFKLYKRIADDKAFSSHLMTNLFDQYRRRLQNGGLTEADVLREIEEGETKHRELKSSLRWNLHTEKNDDRITHAVLKTVAAFQNTEGGVLYIGVEDAGTVLGIHHDGFPNPDKFLLHLAHVVKSALGQAAAARINPKIWTLGDRAICRVECPPSPEPVFVSFKGQEKFYVRSGPSTEEMGPSAMHEYLPGRFRT
jgi:type I restriction enzyme R subunit